MNSHAPTVSRWQGFWITAEQRVITTLLEFGRRHGLGRRALPAHLVTGERGELEALFFLRGLGYQVVERRWRAPGLRGDLDLIAWDGDTLCLVEVKTRTARDLTPAAAAVDTGKRRMLLRMSRAYIRTLPRATRLALRGQDPAQTLNKRVDLVSVYLLPGGVECELLRGIAVDV